jgi:hypothetical protein
MMMQQRYSKLTIAEQRKKLAVSVRLSGGQVARPDHATGLHSQSKGPAKAESLESSTDNTGSSDIHKIPRTLHGHNSPNSSGGTGFIAKGVLQPVSDEEPLPEQAKSPSADPSGIAVVAPTRIPALISSEQVHASMVSDTVGSSAPLDDIVEIDGDSDERPLGSAVAKRLDDDDLFHSKFSSYLSEDIVDA